jgi:YycE-like protein
VTAVLLRIARPTDHLGEVITFYQDGLGFEVLDSFEDLDGYRVVLQNTPWLG